jgi:hypothetical protein
MAHSRALALSVMPGNRRRSSMAAENSPPCSKEARMAAASASETTNMLRLSRRRLRRTRTISSGGRRHDVGSVFGWRQSGDFDGADAATALWAFEQRDQAVEGTCKVTGSRFVAHADRRGPGADVDADDGDAVDHAPKRSQVRTDCLDLGPCGCLSANGSENALADAAGLWRGA